MMKTEKSVRLGDLMISFREIWNYDRKLLLIMVADIIVDAVSPFPSIILAGMIVDSIVGGEEFLRVILYVALMFGGNFLIEAARTLLNKVREYQVLKFVNHLNNEINSKCLAIDFEQFNDAAFQERVHFVGTMAQGNNYLNNLTIAFQTVSQFITLMGIIVIMTMLDIWLLLAAGVMIALQAALHLARIRYNRKYNFDTMNERRKVTYAAQLTRDIEAKKDIQAFGMEGFILDKVAAFQKKLLAFDRKRIQVGGAIEIMAQLLSISFQATAYVILGIEAFRGQMSIGDFTKGISSLINFMSASTFLTMNILNYGDGIFYLHKYKSFLKYRTKFDKMPDGIALDDIDLDHIEIEFRNVSFRYPNSTSFVLKDINLIIRDSEKLAVVGYNGAGKTSFALLLTRMYDPTEGAIYLNGIDIRRINYRDYMKIFSTVNQDFALLAFSILENISNRETATEEERETITKLLQENGMGERLKKMYRGLDTPVTKLLEPSGIDLSGGEKQKIAIVRALYKNSPVLILDEPTSALDPVAEHEIYQKFREMSDGRTTVYISHRIYSTRFCDKIAVFEKGEMKEYGTFGELMERKGLYYDFYQQQAEYFK